MNDKLEYSKQLQTQNALRCVPVHIEIEEAFQKRKEFGVSSEQLGFFSLDESDSLTPSDSHPPMRILRRNFATVIQACTDISLEEKEYILDHRISGRDGAKKRVEYSRNMDRLWRIAQKLDKAPFCKKSFMSPISLKSP